MLQLREYQQHSLNTLEAYLRSVTEHGAQKAFVLATGRPYWSPLQLPGLPYVCLRVPTGGGKTLMASHALGLAAIQLLHREQAVCVWLVPSNAIRDQTLAALQDRGHPYRQVLDAAFGGRVQVMDLAEALYVQRSTLESDTCVIVSTLAAFRVEDTEGRKVYEESGALQHHFARLPDGLGAVLERREGGSFICSLANVLRLWRPVVIVDEAHNARTPLSFETLARFNPSCILEFTATPATHPTPQNVLHHVSARELKAEEMIKLPIKLTTYNDWKEVIAGALATQRTLQEAAQQEYQQTGEYLRPIVLFQAQPRSQERQTLTVEALKECLIQDFQIPSAEIAVATGQTHELDDLNLFDRRCPIKYIITVYALKEGWDCSFAYVLCSVADLHAPRAVEQILGRILRLPRASRKQHDALNCAYAFAASSRFVEAANAIKDALVENGFQRLEAETMVVPESQQELPFQLGPLFPASVPVSAPPDFSALDLTIRQQVTYDSARGQVTLAGPMSQSALQAVRRCFSNPEDQQALGRLYQAIHGHSTLADPGAGPRAPLKVPALAIRVDGQLELFEDTHFLGVSWDLAQCDPTLSKSEFSSEVPAGASGEVDVDEAGQIRFIHEMQQQFTLLLAEPGWTVAGLANWLDRQIPHPDIPQAQSGPFVHRAITALMERGGFGLEQIARQKFRLRDALARKIEGYRRAQAKTEYQRLLFAEGGAALEVNPAVSFEISEEWYAPNAYDEGSYRFKKHYFHLVGELNDEEHECAIFLDTLPQVQCWIRNVDQSASSFWLQTSTDKFYPDFVVVLKDERFLVVEYKNERDWSNDDSKEKRAIGELWAERSGGRCLFIMPQGKDSGAIKSLVEAPPIKTKVVYSR